MTSLELAHKQKAADRKHHEERVAWLSEENPKYACGAPVEKCDVNNMLNESQLCLADATGMRGLRSASIES